MKKIYALFTLILGFVTLSLAQNPSWMVFNTSNSDLPNNTADVIIVDSTNLKWFATGNGATTFNNTSWVQMITNNPISSFAEDSSSRIWIGVKTGLFMYKPQTGTFIYNSLGPAFPPYEKTAMAVDTNNNLWIATAGGGIVMDPGDHVIYNTANSDIPSNTVTALEIDRNNIVWAGTELAGLVSFDGSNWITYNTGNSSLPDNNITSIAIDANNNKWIGTENGGLVKFDGTTFTVYDRYNSAIPGMIVNTVEVDKNNIVWVGTEDGGAGSFNGSSWTVYNTSNSGLPGNEVLSIAFDRANGVWFGTATMGVARLCMAPAASITSSQLSTCEGNAVTLTANSGNYTYQWLLNNNPITGATAATYNATASGYYSVIINDRTACTATSQQVQVVIQPLPPAPAISQSGGMLASSSSNGNQWNLNGNPIPGATNQFFTPAQEGFYTVSVTDTNGCTSTSIPFSFQFTATEEKKNDPLTAKVYPNPSDGKFNIQISNSNVKIVSITLNDILGNVVWRENVAGRNNNEIDVDITGMTPGVYFLNIHTTGRTFTKKISIR